MGEREIATITEVWACLKSMVGFAVYWGWCWKLLCRLPSSVVWASSMPYHSASIVADSCVRGTSDIVHSIWCEFLAYNHGWISYEVIGCGWNADVYLVGRWLVQLIEDRVGESRVGTAFATFGCLRRNKQSTITTINWEDASSGPYMPKLITERRVVCE